MSDEQRCGGCGGIKAQGHECPSCRVYVTIRDVEYAQLRADAEKYREIVKVYQATMREWPSSQECADFAHRAASIIKGEQ